MIDSEKFIYIKDYFTRLSKQKIINKYQIDKITPYLLQYFDTKFIDFLNWETKYENHFYFNHNCQTNSTLFNIVIICILNQPDIIQQDIDEDFLTLSFIYKNFLFKQYNGQGVIWQIYKDNQLIFQNT